jgi:hypothetical protein
MTQTLSTLHLGRARWAVFIGEDWATGLKPFIRLRGTDDINAMGDFPTKRAALDWANADYPMPPNEQLMWATNLKHAYQQQRGTT